MPPRSFFLFVIAFPLPAPAAEPLHAAIDRLIAQKANGTPVSARADDSEFLRRVTLDLAGRIPTAEAARKFLADSSPDKRARLIDELLDGPDYSTRMADLFHVLLMERLGDHDEWMTYLKRSFARNKPWDAMVREMLRANSGDSDARGASFFLAKRLENYGQNPVDYPALTRDVGRLLLGKNLQCAECHDHLFIEDYKQQDFQGLFAFVRSAYLVDARGAVVGEKPVAGRVPYMSVFRKVPKETGPALPGAKPFDPPVFKKGEEYITRPDAKLKSPGTLKFSPLGILSENLPRKENADFSRNAANRIWFLLMGRGLVHPLDLHHQDNPPSHPALLDLLAREFVSHQFDIKWLLREIARSDAYQRSSILPTGAARIAPETFLTAVEKRLSAEQWFATVQLSLGVKGDNAALAKFRKAFANAPREPEEEVNPSLKAALFLLNDPVVLGWLNPQQGNLIDRLTRLSDDALPDELYLSILTRRPTREEKEQVVAYMKEHSKTRAGAAGRLAWALLASSEFGVNH